MRLTLCGHRALELAQSGAGLDAELRDQRLARGAEDLESVCLAASAVQGQHLQRPEALVEGMSADQSVELRDQLGLATARQVRLDRALEGSEAQLVQARGDRARAGLVSEVGQRWSTPQREPGAELGGGRVEATSGECLRACPRLALEDPQVEGAVGHGDDVSASAGADRVAAHGLAQLRDVCLQDVPSGDRRVVAPHLVHESRHRHDLVGVHQQNGQQRSLAGTTEPGRGAVHERIERPEYTELDCHAGRAQLVPALSCGRSCGASGGRGSQRALNHPFAPDAT